MAAGEKPWPKLPIRNVPKDLFGILVSCPKTSVKYQPTYFLG